MSYEYLPLRVPKEKQYPTALLFLDTETHEDEIDANTHQLNFASGCIIFDEIDGNMHPIKREATELNTIDDFYIMLEFYLKSYKKITVFAHNLGFDLRVLYAFHRLSGTEYLTRAPIINQRIFIWSVRTKDRLVHFIDTANLGVSSVEQLGNDIGLPKLEIDFSDFTLGEMKQYCYRDCEIIEKFVLDYLKFLSDNSLGGFCSTLASQALHSYLYRFYDNNLFHHNIKSITDFEKQAYHGGRTEMFRYGKLPKDDYHILDINSMYASIMCDYNLPYKISAYREGDKVSLSDKLLSTKYIIAECIVKTQEQCYPYVIDGFLCFPVGVFTTVLHDEEIRHAVSANHLVRINRFAAYDKDKIFSKYANFFLNERTRNKIEGNESYSLISKLFSNSLYGKVAQRRYIRRKIDTVPDELFGRIPYTNHINGRTGQIIIWNGSVIDEFTDGYSTHTELFTAGAITANGRMMLNNIRSMADIEHVFYCDTDSIMTDNTGLSNLSAMIDASHPGLLKIEKSAQNVEIFGPKDYIFGNKAKTKGIKESAIRLKDGRFEQWNFQSVKAWLRDGAEGSVKLSRVIKHRQGLFNKGVPGDDGWIIPFTVFGSYHSL